MGRQVGQKIAQKIGYPLWMAPYGNMFLVENNPYFCKFHLENGNLKKLSKKHVDVLHHFLLKPLKYWSTLLNK